MYIHAHTPDSAPEFEQDVRQYLERIPDCPTDETLAEIYEGARWLYTVHAPDDEMRAVAVVNLSYIPKPMLLVHVLAGDGMDDWAELLNDALIETAREVGVQTIRGYGRRGFARALHDYGWREVSTICELELSHA